MNLRKNLRKNRRKKLRKKPEKEPKVESKKRESPIDEEQSPAVPSIKESTGPAKPAKFNVPVKTKKQYYAKEAITNEKSNTEQFLKDETEKEPEKEPKKEAEKKLEKTPGKEPKIEPEKEPEEKPEKEPEVGSKERESPIDEEQSPAVPSIKEPTGPAKPAKLNVPVKTKKQLLLKGDYYR